MPLTLTWKGPIGRPVDGDDLRPETLNGSLADVARIRVPAGNSTLELGELFELKGNGGDGHLIFEGDLRPVRGLASGMSRAGWKRFEGTLALGLDRGCWGARSRWKGRPDPGPGRRFVAVCCGFEAMPTTCWDRPCREADWECGETGSSSSMATLAMTWGLALRRGLDRGPRGSSAREPVEGMIAGSIFGSEAVGRGARLRDEAGARWLLFGVENLQDIESVAGLRAEQGHFRPHILSI